MNAKPLNTTYADLFDGDEPGLALLIEDLDALYVAPEPPANMLARFEQLLRQRTQPEANGRVTALSGAIPPPARGTLPLARPEPAPIPLPARPGARARLKQVAGIAAAVLVFAMVAIVLAQIFGAGGDDDGQQGAPVDATPTGQIAFVSERDGNAEIYSINSDGSGLQRLTDNPGFDVSPDWSPDGERIAFVSERDGVGGLYLMDADGSDLQRLSGAPEGDTAPVWAPRGIYSPLWSPDGAWIAFGSWNETGGLDIFVIRPDGTDLRRLTTGMETSAMSWSPTSQALTFHAIEMGSSSQIYLVGLDGLEPYNLTDDTEAHGFPDWSPLDTYIAYTTDNLNPRIQVRHRHIPVVDGGVTDTGVAGSISRWSPDGQWLAYRDSEQQLAVMRLDGADQRQLTGVSGTIRLYDWSPDSQHLAFLESSATDQSAPTSPASLYTVSMDGTEPRLLTDEAMPQIRPAWRPDPSHVPPALLTPESSPTPAPTPTRTPIEDIAASPEATPRETRDQLYVVSHAMSRNLDAVAVAGRVSALDPTTGEEYWSVDAGPRIDSVLSPDGQRLFIADSRLDGDHVYALDTQTGRELWRQPIENRQWHKPGGGYSSMLSVSEDGGVVSVYACEGCTGEIRFNTGRNWLAQFDTSTGNRLADREVAACRGTTIVGPESSASRALHVICDSNRQLEIVDLTSGQPLTLTYDQGLEGGFPETTGINASVVSPDGRWLYLASGNRLTVVDLTRLSAHHVQLAQDINIERRLPLLAVSPDGELLFIGSLDSGAFDQGRAEVNRVDVYETATWETLGRIPTSSSLNGTAFTATPDGDAVLGTFASYPGTNDTIVESTILRHTLDEEPVTVTTRTNEEVLYLFAGTVDPTAVPTTTPTPESSPTAAATRPPVDLSEATIVAAINALPESERGCGATPFAPVVPGASIDEARGATVIGDAELWMQYSTPDDASPEVIRAGNSILSYWAMPGVPSLRLRFDNLTTGTSVEPEWGPVLGETSWRYTAWRVIVTFPDSGCWQAIVTGGESVAVLWLDVQPPLEAQSNATEDSHEAVIHNVEQAVSQIEAIALSRSSEDSQPQVIRVQRMLLSEALVDGTWAREDQPRQDQPNDVVWEIEVVNTWLPHSCLQGATREDCHWQHLTYLISADTGETIGLRYADWMLTDTPDDDPPAIPTDASLRTVEDAIQQARELAPGAEGQPARVVGARLLTAPDTWVNQSGGTPLSVNDDTALWQIDLVDAHYEYPCPPPLSDTGTCLLSRVSLLMRADTGAVLATTGD